MSRRGADWALPWLVCALAALQASLADPVPVPGALALAGLVWTAWRPGSGRVPRASPWLLAAPFAAWWVVLAASSDPRPERILVVGAWYLVLLSLLQLASGGGAPGWRNWNAATACMLAGFRPDGIRIAVAALLALAVLLDARRAAARAGGAGFRPAWFAGALLAAGIGALAHVSAGRLPMGSFEAWRPEGNAKGFSPVFRLGGGFSVVPDPSEDVVALRAWSRRAPSYMKGAVFDTYVHGSWTRQEPWRAPASERAHLEFSMYCLESDRMAPVEGWAVASGSTEGHLLTPSDAVCVGVVSDSVEAVDGGAWRLGGPGLSRGWVWARGRAPGRVLPAERTVPRGMRGLVDSALQAAGAAGEPATVALPRIESWLGREFRYTLHPRVVAGEDPLRTFAREREGYCEHFATLAALLARGAGIPSRVVTGYAHPESTGGAWIYRRSHAHAWVELRLADGWRTWDPTPAGDDPVPRRSRFRRLADGVGTWSVALWHQLRDGSWRGRLDAAFAEGFQPGPRSFAVAALVAGAAVALLVVWRRRRRGARTDWEEDVRRAERHLAREGFARGPGETIGAFLLRLPDGAHAGSRRLLERYQEERWRSRDVRGSRRGNASVARSKSVS